MALLRPDALSQDAAKLLFEDTSMRPDPLNVADLIADGLTEQHVIAAAYSRGYTQPRMEQTLVDLDTIIPHVQRLSDTLATHHPDATRLLFAGRDAELMQDDFAIRWPGIPNSLLPASQDLWHSDDMRWMAEDFLTPYGLDRDRVMAGDSRFTVVDTGFYGTIGRLLDETLMQTYDVNSLRSCGTLAVKLVCAAPESLGRPIMEIPEAESAFGPDALPRYYSWMEKRDTSFYHQTYGQTFPLATALQLMPRYHGTFIGLKEQGDRVVALTSTKEADGWVDSIDSGTEKLINASVVNPMAAAIAQYRVVRAAMERSAEQQEIRHLTTADIARTHAH